MLVTKSKHCIKAEMNLELLLNYSTLSPTRSIEKVSGRLIFDRQN